jgi:nucleotide-binding universal stress UspA family protein
MTITRILVPIDFLANSRQALDCAFRFGASEKAEPPLIHVLEPIRHARLVPEVSQLREQLRMQAFEKLAELEHEARSRHRKCRSEVHSGPT